MDEKACGCSSLRSEVADLRKQLTLLKEGWKPFDSAPDNVFVDLLYQDGEVLVAHRDGGCWLTRDGGNAHRPWEGEPDPTHWRPI